MELHGASTDLYGGSWRLGGGFYGVPDNVGGPNPGDLRTHIMHCTRRRRALTRFYDPSEGKITLDGRDVKEFNVRWLRTQVRRFFRGAHFSAPAAPYHCSSCLCDPRLDHVVSHRSSRTVLPRLRLHLNEVELNAGRPAWSSVMVLVHLAVC